MAASRDSSRTLHRQRRILPTVSDRTARLRQAFAALDEGDITGFRDLFAEEAVWLGVPGSGIDGFTPI
jgi:ketosteroid isomerase-like protein